MNYSPSGEQYREIPFSDDDFRSLAELAKLQFGLNLSVSKKPLVYSRLSKRLKTRNIPSFPEYMKLLGTTQETDEKFELISALTTNVTSFFRESHHFDTLGDLSRNRFLEKVKSGARIRIWSAGCSAGPEPYSIAMTLLHNFPEAIHHDVKILATDIDPKIVNKARGGVYAIDELEGIPTTYRSKWTEISSDGTRFHISKKLKDIVTFNELNLISEWPFKGPFDSIFCRNVAIYFDQSTQQRLWNRFCQMLVPDGHLFIGHSERVTGAAASELEGIGITSYRKINNSAETKRK